MLEDIERVLISEEELKSIVDNIGKQISEDYKDKDLLLVSVLKGSVVFMADLMRAITIPCNIDFMAVSSYGNSTESSGRVNIVKDLSQPVDGKDIVIVEDIIDSGNTLSCLMELLEDRQPNSLRLCTLLDKPERRVKDVYVDYTGFQIPDKFVVGYGLDFDQKYRNLPYIGVVSFEEE